MKEPPHVRIKNSYRLPNVSQRMLKKREILRSPMPNYPASRVALIFTRKVPTYLGQIEATLLAGYVMPNEQCACISCIFSLGLL